ncbi:ABC transporter permease [Campylobacter sp. 19-13652]|uniref:ABC transporter permease n=1 Tax=Campylobacter sp. 19-13652 TaxID=2840180 RepID=UPI001C799F5B|nr:ABC transporter permease [Campylobacter sp. 19-13652]BCX79320.1 permease [Campylobacter sp. 19-13652]
MSLVRFLAPKYLRFDKTQPFITLSALLAFLGVSVGLMVLIVAMALMNGFDKDFERKLFTMNYPITILSPFSDRIDDELLKTLQEKFKSLKFSPYISSQAILKGEQGMGGAMVFGVNSALEKEINEIVKDALKEKEIDGFSLLVGSGLAQIAGAKSADKATLIFTTAEAGGLSVLPKIKRFNIKGEFSSGLVAYDKLYVYTSLKALSSILGYESGKYDGIHVFSSKPFDDIKALKSTLPVGVQAIGWWQQNGNFFSALALEKRALFIVLMLIVLVASLNIISSLLMTVMNRRSEIALLLSLGASKAEIKKSFFLQGMAIGGSGIIFGVALGLVGIFLLGNFDIISLPADVYGSSKLPLELSTLDFSLIVTGSILMVALSSYYPAKKASEVDVLTTLRNE